MKPDPIPQPEPPKIPFPTVEQLAHVAALIASKSPTGINNAEGIAEEAWDLWVACGSKIQSKFREAVDRRGNTEQTEPEEWKPEPPANFPADVDEVLRRLFPTRKNADRWSLLRGYLKQAIRVGKLGSVFKPSN